MNRRDLWAQFIIMLLIVGPLAGGAIVGVLLSWFCCQ